MTIWSLLDDCSGKAMRELQTFTLSKTPLDRCAWAKALSQLRRYDNDAVHVFQGEVDIGVPWSWKRSYEGQKAARRMSAMDII